MPIGQTPDSPWNTQVGGDHYTKMKIQPFEYSMANNLDPLQHTIIKYVTRFRDKNGVVDLEKAKHCIDLLIAHEKEKANEGIQGQSQDGCPVQHRQGTDRREIRSKQYVETRGQGHVVGYESIAGGVTFPPLNPIDPTTGWPR